MSLLALAVCAALAALGDCSCPVGLEPLNQTRHLLKASRNISWREGEMWCKSQFPGFAMLRWDTEQCRGEEVSLGPVVLTGSPRRSYEDAVNSTRTVPKRDERKNMASTGAHVGNRGTGTLEWRLLDRVATSQCVVCEPTRVTSLEVLDIAHPPSRPAPYTNAYILRIKKIENNQTEVTKVIDQVVSSLLQTRGIQTVFERLIYFPWLTLRVKSSAALFDDWVSSTLPTSLTLEDWHDLDLCPAMILDGINWEQTRRGRVSAVGMPNFHWATKHCTVQYRLDGDFDAVWDLGDTRYWYDHEEACKNSESNNLAAALSQLTEDEHTVDVQVLAEKTANATDLNWPRHSFYPSKDNVSHELFGVLSTLLVSTNKSVDRACVGDACAFMTAENKTNRGPDTLIFTARDVPPMFVNSKDTDYGDLPYNLTIHIPSELTSANNVAFHTIQGDEIRNSPYFQPRQDGVLKFSLAVIVHVAFDMPFDDWQTAGKWPVTFRVNISEEGGGKNHYFSVWSLGDSAATTQPCSHARQAGSTDTFLCDTFKRGPRNFTTGKFLAFVGVKNVSTVYPVINNLYHGYMERRLLKPNATGGDIANDTVTLVNQPRFKILVTGVTGNDPVVGFSLEGLSGKYGVRHITSSQRNDAVNSAADVVLGTRVAGFCKRFEMLVVNDLEHFRPAGPLGSLAANDETLLMVFHVAVIADNEVDASARNDLYLDFQVDVVKEMGVEDSGRLLVESWDDKERAWSVTTCIKRRSTHNSKLVYRCSTLFEGNEFQGTFLISRAFGLVDYLGETLVWILTICGVLSGVSLASIVGTAAAMPGWRKNIGRKIFLQMTLALSLNLAFGFVSSFASVDTASVACVAVGALRHFSYLAMFAWMLVMSSLQLQRMVSILGSNTSRKLFLKTTVFGWGLPLIAVSCFVTLNKEMYRSDTEDRGYCYPEGVEFMWSVQAPAATVLALNAVIFVVILARLYSFRGWGVTKDLRRHLNERTMQIRRLKAVFFTFCLFGITWVVHLLAEQGAFKGKYLEYVFLMTASVHLLSLSCFFVFFNKGTRAQWRKIFTSLRTNVAEWCSCVRVLKSLERTETELTSFSRLKSLEEKVKEDN